MLNIAVCIKAVPDEECYNIIKFDPVMKTLIREGISMVINPSDLHALELALCLKEKLGGEITLISMGPMTVTTQLRECLSYGADEAYLMSDCIFGGSDTLATSYVLSKGLRHIGNFDLVLAGNESADGATSHVPSQLGEWLGYPHVMEVCALNIVDEKIAAVRKKADNYFVDYTVKLPAVFAVSRGMNKVRYPSIRGILSSKGKEIKVLTAESIPDLDISMIGLQGSPTKTGQLITSSFHRDCMLLDGSNEEIASAILGMIRPVIDD
ncbi:MAG: electron transfer flavoprotein subunit beta/FixA family protein [Clostridiaceae bacterium]|jgi:electron transfer flavoprotein beta subunit|nr:electron transfer flavoprotein subunit beta/FixA family protein [Clostridiaceae bacterium]